jgi:hypothetical protein
MEDIHEQLVLPFFEEVREMNERESLNEGVIYDVFHELDRQLEKWGVQNHESYLSTNKERELSLWKGSEQFWKNELDRRTRSNEPHDWYGIFHEEFSEMLVALAESGEDSDDFQKEMTQCIAVLVAWQAATRARTRA